MKPFPSTLSFLLLFASAAIVSSIHTLQFNPSGSFTILQFTDMHCGSLDSVDENTFRLQRQMISLTNPDLVILSGDAASIPGAIQPGWFEATWKKFTEALVDAQIPYAYTLGNHDDEGDLNRKQIVQLDQTNSFSLRSQSEGIPDTANFYMPVYSSRNNQELAANIWVLDSGSYNCEDVHDGYGCIESDVVEWYNEKSQEIKDQHGTNIHHLAYFHIPIPEYMNVYNYQQIYGIAGEYTSCPVKNTGFFEAARKNGDITAMFCGHDHDNDFGGWYEGIELIYGRKSGYNQYGDIHGARVVVLKENYDASGKLTVTRDHHVIDVSGSVENTAPLFYRRGEKQLQCPSDHEDEKKDSLLTGLQKSVFILMIILYLVC